VQTTTKAPPPCRRMNIHRLSCPCTWKISVLSILTYILLVTPSSLSNSYSDFLALLSLKSHITSDPRQALSSWDGARNDTNTPVPDFCQWNGVTCGGRRYPGHVTAIHLQDYGLAGIISQDIGNLAYLHFLDLSSNNLVTACFVVVLHSCTSLHADLYVLTRLHGINCTYLSFVLLEH